MLHVNVKRSELRDLAVYPHKLSELGGQWGPGTPSSSSSDLGDDCFSSRHLLNVTCPDLQATRPEISFKGVEASMHKT
ncbi:hypothetical protein RRG08_026233 [Elysia crispata]|uniref:Uncharacterized protein n=1 Tax=Elysia crispata TaxID=231223 RepID=A0AAE0ZC75_9GAST|nr:hypothetical protein RRG08_026233 [Elysia crispata]